MADWTTITAVAELQHLVLAPWQLSYLDASWSAVAQRRHRHGWDTDTLGVVWLPGPPDPVRFLAAAVLAYSRPRSGAQRVVDRLARGQSLAPAVAGAALEAGQTVCGPSAAWLHGIGPAPDRHWLRLPGRSGHAKRAGVALRYGRPSEVRWVRGLPTTTVEQSVIDSAAVATGPFDRSHLAIVRMMTVADRKRLATVDSTEALLSALGPVDGAALVAGAITDLRGQMNHSRAEKRAREILAPVLAERGLVLHPRPYTVVHDGQRAGEADLPVLAIRYGIEIDGPHHDLPDQRDADRRRDRRMRRAGWTIDRFSVDVVERDPGTLAATVGETADRLLAQEALTRTVLTGVE